MTSLSPITAPALVGLAVAALMAPASAQAQSASSAQQYQAGYGNARYSTARPSTGSTRDANGNRLIVDGIIQSGASSYSRQSGGVSQSFSGVGGGDGGVTGGSTAIGNNLNVVVQGNRNTVIINSTQNNTGNVTAGTSLNGAPRTQ